MDEFTNVLGVILVGCHACWIEIESEFIWGLTHPSHLSGEGGYYLTILSSTIHSLKNLDSSAGATGEEGGANIGSPKVEGGGANVSETVFCAFEWFIELRQGGDLFFPRWKLCERSYCDVQSFNNSISIIWNNISVLGFVELGWPRLRVELKLEKCMCLFLFTYQASLSKWYF